MDTNEHEGDESNRCGGEMVGAVGRSCSAVRGEILFFE